MKGTSIKIKGKIGYHSVHKLDRYQTASGKNVYKFLLGISDESFSKLEALDDVETRVSGGLQVVEGKLSPLGIDGKVIQAQRLEEKGKVSVLNADGTEHEGLIGFGSEVIFNGFISSYEAKDKSFSKMYIDSIEIVNLIPVELDKDNGNVQEAII